MLSEHPREDVTTDAIELPVRSSPANADYQRSCGSYQLSIGKLRVHLGQFAEAEENAQAAQLLLESAGRDPDNTIASRELIQLYDFRGDLCEQKSEGAQARRWYQRPQETIRSHTAMDIPASDQADWTALCEKLAAKTATDTVQTLPR